MDRQDLMDSKWGAAARNPEARARLLDEFPVWIDKAKNSDVVHKARRLWEYLISDKSSIGDVLIVVAALLYLISPFDAIPDFIPFAGWLDDVAVAGMVLGYLDRKASGCSASPSEE